MRILQVVHYFLPRHRAGVEVYTYDLARELSKDNELWIYCREDGYFNKEYHESDEIFEGLRVKRIYYNVPLDFRTSYRNELIERHFESFLDSVAPDVVHFQHLERMSVGLIESVRRKGIPSVLTLHDYWFICPLIQLLVNNEKPCPLPYSPQRCLGCLERWAQNNRADVPVAPLEEIENRTSRMRDILAKVDVVISPSQFLIERFEDFGVRAGGIKFIEHGIDTGALPALKKGACSRKVHFGFVGTIISHKGLHLLKDAFGALDNDNAELVIFGEGYDNYSRQLISSLKKDRRIRYNGPFERKDTAEVFSGIDVLVVPSVWYENSPLVIQEAFFTGTPVIASDIGALAEKIRDGQNGLLFKVNDSRDLREKLRMVADDVALRKRLGACAGGVKPISEHAAELGLIYRKIRGDKPARNERAFEMKEYNSRLLNEAIKRKDIYLRAMPVDMNIETTLECNLNCLMCQRMTVDRKSFHPPMKIEAFRRLARESFLYLNNISLTVIGEPLLSRNLDEMLELIKRYSVKLELITNGTLLSGDGLVEKLLDVLSVINISLDAACPDTYGKIRRGGDFNKVVANIRRFNEMRGKRKNSRPLLYLSFVAMRSNIDELPDFIALARSLEADLVNVNHITVFNDSLSRESLSYHQKAANDCFLRAKLIAQQNNVNLIVPPLYPSDSPPARLEAGRRRLRPSKIPRQSVRDNGLKCPDLWKKVFILAGGAVVPCCGSPERPVMGNILKQSLMEIWNNSVYLKMRKGILTGELFDCCRNCRLIG